MPDPVHDHHFHFQFAILPVYQVLVEIHQGRAIVPEKLLHKLVQKSLARPITNPSPGTPAVRYPVHCSNIADHQSTESE
jgi:hypothetical protein